MFAHSSFGGEFIFAVDPLPFEWIALNSFGILTRRFTLLEIIR
jgi:hypothetical protein